MLSSSSTTRLIDGSARSSSAFAQAAVTAYLSTMPWREQLKTYREVYRERRDALLSAMTDLMPAGTTWTVPGGGLFVWANLGAESGTQVIEGGMDGHDLWRFSDST